MNGESNGVPPVEALRQQAGRFGLILAVTGLPTGVLLWALSKGEASIGVLATTIGAMAILPVINVLAIVVEEVRRRDWAFMGLALAVVGLLGFSLVGRLLR